MKKLGLTLGSKIIVIFIGAFVLLGALAWGFSKPWRGPWRDQLPKVVWINLRAHLISVADSLGQPPNEEKAREVLKELRLDVLVREKGETLFSTSNECPKWHEIEEEIQEEIAIRQARPDSLRSRLGDFLIGRTKGRMFAVLERAGRQYVFCLPEREGLQAGLRAFAGFAFTMAFLLLIVLGVTNWLLRPMKPLMRGVAELSRGNLDYRLAIRPRGEFRRMGEAFNTMAETLQRQLKSKDQLLMDVSHELRSPLGRIKMAAEMLPEASGASAPSSDLRTQIQADVREMEDLVSELLELYRLRDVSQKPINSNARSEVASELSSQLRSTDVLDFGQLVRDAIAPLLQNGWPGGATPGIEYRLPTKPVFVKGDDRQLKRAIRNLVENAVKFSRHQSRPVEVTLEERTGGSGEDAVCELRVRDYGVGMTNEQCKRVFEPFYRADSSRVRETGGFGLGLPMAQAIVHAHGGTIECRSFEGEANEAQGAAFTIRLALARNA